MKINLTRRTESGAPAALRRRSTTLITIVMVTSAGVLAGGTGLARASAATRAAQPVHFQVVNPNVTASTSPVIAYGAFTGAGTDIMGNTTDTFKFAGGTFQVFHSPGSGPQSFDPRTCVFMVHQHGTFSLSHGTGRFAAISGHGTYQISILGIGARVNGTCSQNAQPVASQLIIDASGLVSL